MAQAFAADPERDGALVGRMEPVELELVIEVLTQTRELLAAREPQAAPSGEENGENELFARLSASMEARPAPEDPALRRLLPDGVAADEGASDAEDTTGTSGSSDAANSAREFRRLTEDTIRHQKQQNLDLAIEAFARHEGRHRAKAVVLSRVEARAAMIALTDVRLVLAERLELHTEADTEELHARIESLDAPSNARDLTAMYYDFITWLSESLTVAYLGQPGF